VEVFAPSLRHRSLYAFSSELMPTARKRKTGTSCISLLLLFEFSLEVRSLELRDIVESERECKEGDGRLKDTKAALA